MVDQQTLERGLALTLEQTDLSGLGERIPGKVRDSYVGERAGQRVRTIVVTDRISAFDVVLGTVPFKGQVLNGIAAYWFSETASLVPNHLLEVPDPAVSVVQECEVFPVEMIVRGYLTGSSPTSIWTHYAQGERSYCGHRLPDGLAAHARLPEPIVTPTTKGRAGEHDELISRDQLVERGLLSAAEYDELSAICLRLFRFGSELAASRGLILVDTKYELGRRPDGTIVVVDEIHTPDSSRYWYAASYAAALQQGAAPRALDKDYVRRWLLEAGFKGEGTPPALPDEVRVEAARRYIEIYEQITGQPFTPSLELPEPRIRKHLGL